MKGNTDNLAGIPVKVISDVAEFYSEEEKNDLEIIIATPENIQQEIEGTLDGYGFFNHSRVTSERWGELMDALYAKNEDFMPLRVLEDGEEERRVCGSGNLGCDINIFYARSHKDKALRSDIARPDYMHAIQVGAANTDDRIADIVDDQGDNISTKNGNYCELTGLYWVWKNKTYNICDGGSVTESKHDDATKYLGFAQYRRGFELTEDDLDRFVINDIDVLLPYPLIYEPDINMHHERYLKDGDWKALLAALEELQPEYADFFCDVLRQQCMYNYNVIIAKEQVLRDYCEWLFPILERVEELSIPKGSERSDRYIGYMGETLETLYFMKNKDMLKIAHKECKMYV
ncbi:DUF4422 domain-containing protein [Butyrivibrio sp. AE3003]|uniref:DUF4422 domain-containing protein n=1 Tax=Butyrivibrio sp. AE3003 TaxID=1496721 RepID=UPI001FA769BA|nr:DUF4422 domain-containing protein [Butyrivibrio sp. AE3003]